MHYLSGPLNVEGAQPGDLLVVEICDIVPLPGEEWGFTGVLHYIHISIVLSKLCDMD